MTIKISGFQVGAATGIPQYGTAPVYYSTGIGTADGGNGLAQVSFNAPVNGTAISFVTSDKSGNTEGYMNNGDGWADIFHVQNNAGNWWEHIWLSTKQIPSLSIGEIATSQGFLNGRFIAVVEVLNGTDQSPSQVGGAFYAQQDYSNTITLNAYGINTDEFGVLCIGVEGHDNPGGRVTSVVSGSGLTWTKKSSKSTNVTLDNAGRTDLYQTCDIWYTHNSGGVISNETVTVTFDGTFDDASLLITNFSNVNIPSAWAS